MSAAILDQIGQLLIIGIEGTELDASTRELLTTVRPGGVILFRRNMESSAQIAALTRAIRAEVTPSPVLAVDQEGGRVSRLSPPFPPLPSAWRLGRLEMTEVVRWFGSLMGRGLRCLGFQLDFAPVVDLSQEDIDDGIGDRAFAATPAEAASRAAQLLAGLADAGVAGCLKHFPGLGGSPADTHLELPTTARDEASLAAAVEPYRRLREVAPMVMVAHAHYPILSGPEPVPASLDGGIVDGLLRHDVGFAGVIVSDDMEMGAVANRAPMADLAVEAVAAGNDQLLICHRADRIVDAWEGLRRAADGGDLDGGRLQRSLARVAAFRARDDVAAATEPYAADELEVVLDEMRALGDEVDRALRRRGE